MSVVDTLGALARKASAADALDLGKVDEVEGLLGEATVVQMMDRLARDVAERLSDARMAGGTSEVAADAHACVSSTGFLGFSALSAACSALERACRQNGPRESALADMIAERDRAFLLLASFREAAARPVG